MFYEGMKQKIMGVATKNRKGKSKLVSIVFFRNTLQISNHFILFPEILHPRQKGFLFVGRKIADLPVEIVLLKGSLCETLIKKEKKKQVNKLYQNLGSNLGSPKMAIAMETKFFSQFKTHKRRIMACKNAVATGERIAFAIPRDIIHITANSNQNWFLLV